MLQILCSSVRVKLLARLELIFLREQPDDFFFLWGTLIDIISFPLIFVDLKNTFFKQNFRKFDYLVSIFKMAVRYHGKIILVN